MLFNSYPFLFVFLPVAFVGFFAIAKWSHHLAAMWLVAASLVFYGYWNAIYVNLLLASIFFNYGAGYLISHSISRTPRGKRGKTILVGAIVCNLALLGYFKYANFFIDNLGSVLGTTFDFASVMLPLGISFFTFTQIAFLVDTHEGKANEYNFAHYALFVTYFPHLIAGPILHHRQVMPQFSAASTYRIDTGNIAIGVTLMAIGLFKKVMLADNFASFANPAFDGVGNGVQLTLFEAWGGAIAYSMQIYFDFSGYSDMALGLSRIFNVKLPFNFDSPYKATNIIDFWRRWHMTLSEFLRDYLYFPLGGNRLGKTRRYSNLMITMLLGGLWHGANWTFIAWGGLHGLYLIVNHGWRGLLAGDLGANGSPHAKSIGIVFTFVMVVIAWVFFRSDNLHDAFAYLAGMMGLNGISLPPVHGDGFIANSLNILGIGNGGFFPLLNFSGREYFALILAGAWIIWGLPNSQQFVGIAERRYDYPRKLLRWKPTTAYAMVVGCLLAISVFSLNKTTHYLYFQF